MEKIKCLSNLQEGDKWKPCVICKIMESLIEDQFVLHLAQNQLLRTPQYGFMSGRSTLTNLLEYLEVLTKLLDEG